jgi:hypothetical protein
MHMSKNLSKPRWTAASIAHALTDQIRQELLSPSRKVGLLGGTGGRHVTGSAAARAEMVIETGVSRSHWLMRRSTVESNGVGVAHVVSRQHTDAPLGRSAAHPGACPSRATISASLMCLTAVI